MQCLAVSLFSGLISVACALNPNVHCSGASAVADSVPVLMLVFVDLFSALASIPRALNSRAKIHWCAGGLMLMIWIVFCFLLLSIALLDKSSLTNCHFTNLLC